MAVSPVRDTTLLVWKQRRQESISAPKSSNNVGMIEASRAILSDNLPQGLNKSWQDSVKTTLILPITTSFHSSATRDIDGF